MISKLLKKRKINTQNRLYSQDSILNETAFKPGTYLNLEATTNKLVIKPSKQPTGLKVSKRNLKTMTKPVIDIRDKSILSIFQGSNELTLLIYEDHLEIIGKEKILQLGKKRKQLIASMKMTKFELKAAVGFENQISLFDTICFTHNVSGEVQTKIKKTAGEVLNVVSLFSGLGSMDKAFKDSGYNLKFALELESDMCKTYRANLGDHIVCADINKYNLEDIPDAEIIIAGSPCQDFSNANRNNTNQKVLDSPKNILVRKFIEVVKKTKSCLVAVLENVPQLITKGKVFLEEVMQELKDFDVTVNLLNAADFGSAQERKRALVIASKVGPITITPPKFAIRKTVRQAFEGLTDSTPNQMDYSKAKEDTLKKMKYIKPGQNFEAIPIEIRPKSQQSNMFRRLEWDDTSCTIVNVRKAQILHPEKNRILTIRECCRLFDLPDTYRLYGKLDSMQQMIANGIPVKLMRHVAEKIKNAIDAYRIQLA